MQVEEQRELSKEIEILRSKLTASIDQNNRLLSIIELSKCANGASSDQNLTLVSSKIQESIPGHTFSMLVTVGRSHSLIKQVNARTSAFTTDKIELPRLKGVDTFLYNGDSPEVETVASNLPSYFDFNYEPEKFSFIPLRVGSDAELLGFFIVYSPIAPLDEEELRILEACQRQVSHLLHTFYLYQLSNIDSLTGLYNRRYAEGKLEYELKRARRKNSPLSVLMLDLDHFKRINDQYGHVTGDRVLAQTGILINDLLREVDVAARMGGEEFLIFLPDTDAASARIVGERVQSKIASQEFSHGDQRFSVTISIGITLFDPEKDNEVLRVIERADTALYRSKELGRNQIVTD